MTIPFPSNEEPTQENLKKYGKAIKKLTNKNMKILYTLFVKDEDTDETIGSISAYSEESLIEQSHKIEKAVEDYKKEKATDEIQDQSQKWGEEKVEEEDIAFAEEAEKTKDESFNSSRGV